MKERIMWVALILISAALAGLISISLPSIILSRFIRDDAVEVVTFAAFFSSLAFHFVLMACLLWPRRRRPHRLAR